MEVVPSLRVHGVLQAAIALGNQRPFGPSRPADVETHGTSLFSDLNSGTGDAVGKGVLERTAIFFDYSCIPQGMDLHGLTADDPSNHMALEQALRRLHLLVDSSTVLSLRSAGDDYGNRAWCAAELAIGQPPRRHIVLRTDLMGTPVTDVQIVGESTTAQGLGTSAGAFDQAAREEMLRIDYLWGAERFGWGVLRLLADQVYMGQHQLEAERAVPVMVTGRAPRIFSGQKSLLVHVIQRLKNLSILDGFLNGDLDIPDDDPIRKVDESDLRRVLLGQSLDSGEGLADIADIAIESLLAADIHCLVPADRAYVALQILHARHVGQPQFANFFAECLVRYIDGRTTRVTRYRELRDGLEMRLWRVFADEIEPPGGWKAPSWATL